MKKQNRLRNILAIPLVTSFFFLLPASVAQILDEDGSHVRIKRNSDGTSTQYKRDHTNTQLEQTSFVEKENGEKVTRTRTVYRRDKDGRLRSGIIEDGGKNKLYRIIYGYHKDTGRLIAENMYDDRVIRKNDIKDLSKETPIRALRYTYNPQGERSKPIIFSAQPGKTAEELKKYLNENGSSRPTYDPWRNSTVNPNAKPLKR